MSVSAPSWRLVPRVLPVRSRTHQVRSLAITPRRLADDDSSPKRPNPILEEYLRKNPKPVTVQRAQQPPANHQTTGDLSASSIFEDNRRAAQQGTEDQELAPRSTTPSTAARDPRHRLRITDPNPNARERFERKKVIQMVRRGGRLSKEEFLKRTEREHLAKSVNLKTSVKKLGMLARQIQGKTVEDAITQMRFSKKKIASEVLKQLEFARDEAVVMRGMGLGAVKVEDEAGTGETAVAAAQSSRHNEILEIQLKDGKRHAVSDRSTIYVDQAWVGRGPYGRLPDYRARGQMNIIRTPWTSISLLLKEESTRVREFAERTEKRRRQKLDNVWVHLPDRPIQTKQQWYSW